MNWQWEEDLQTESSSCRLTQSAHSIRRTPKKTYSPKYVLYPQKVGAPEKCLDLCCFLSVDCVVVLLHGKAAIAATASRSKVTHICYAAGTGMTISS